MPGSKIIYVRAYWIVTVVAFMAAIAMLVMYTPDDKEMGVLQKVFYLHLPVAVNTFCAAMIVFIASIGYLWQRCRWWDDLASAAGIVTVLFCTVVLLTGMIWGRGAWHVWWTWSPRLTLSLVLWLLYVVYLLIRPSIDSPQRRATVSAVYGIIAFLDVPLVYLSVKLMEDLHPSSIELALQMKITVLVWFVPVTLLAGGLIVTRYRLNVLHRELQERTDAAHHGEER